jgi:hypothetical protein
MRPRVLFLTMLIVVTSLLFISSGVLVGAAQSEDASCAALVQTAFEQFNTSCADVPGSKACFGNSAKASSSSGDSDGFSKPGDQLDLSEVQSVQTLPLSEADEQWGLALVNVHANVPLALSDQGIKYFLLGDVTVENGVDAASAFTPVESLTVTPLVAANLRSSPSTDARVLANAPVGTELEADGLSGDGAWIRVLNGNQTAWISRQIVASNDGDIGTLPVIGSDTRTLMQDIFLDTGNGSATCTDAPPSMLVMQAPNGVNASIKVNGVEVRFEGAIVLHVSDDNIMQVVVLNGGANVEGVSVPSGFTLNVPLSEDGRDIGGSATGLRPINEGERNILTPAAAGISDGLLYTALSVPTQEQIAAILAQLNGASGAQVVSGPAAGQADCGRFKPTSPLGSMALGTSPFYWDAAPGATAYRLNFYSGDGSLINSVDANSTTTTIQIDTSGLGAGTNFSWSVDAVVNGQVACSSGKVSVVRDAFGQFVSDGGNGGNQQESCAGGWSGC